MLYNSAFFYKQFEFIWLFGIFGAAVKVSCEVDAPCRHPVALYDSLVWRPVVNFPFTFDKNVIT